MTGGALGAARWSDRSALLGDVVGDVRAGGLVVLFDGGEPEHGGSLVAAAGLVTDHTVNFMARHGRGVIAVCLTPERCADLRLSPMATSQRATTRDVMVTIEAREGITTGISAADRARTIAVAADPATGRESLAVPGHIVPLRASPGGVLERAGVVEGAVELARLAGLAPAAAVCGILTEGGDAATGPELERYSERHGLRLLDTRVLAEHARDSAPLVEPVDEIEPPARDERVRAVRFRETATGAEHVALVRGEVDEDADVLVHAYERCVLADLLTPSGCDCRRDLGRALERCRAEERSVVVCLDSVGDTDWCPRCRRSASPIQRVEPRRRRVLQAILGELGVIRPRFLEGESA